MIKITLDTNCIINLLDFESKTSTSVDSLSEIIKYALEGDTNIVITTRVSDDLENDRDDKRKLEMLKKINMFPVIGTIARFDKTKYGNGDVYVGKEQIEIEKNVRDLLYPKLKKGDHKFNNKINDIDHIVGHIINKRDIFVTDDKLLLRKRETLQNLFNILIMSPRECVDYLDKKGVSLVLAQQFYDKFCKYKDFIKSLKVTTKPEEEEEYREYREWFVLKFPKLRDGLYKFRLKMVSQPIYGQDHFNIRDLNSVKIEMELLPSFYQERKAKKQRDEIIKNESDIYISENDLIGHDDKIEDKFDKPLNVLLEYVGYLNE